MAVAFAVMFMPACKMIGQMKIQVTSVLKIGLNIVYSPFIVFMIIILIYIISDMILEFMVMTGIGGEAAVKKMLDETKNETQEAIEAAEAMEEAMKKEAEK